MKDLTKLGQPRLEQMLDELEAKGVYDGAEHKAIDEAIDNLVDRANKAEELYIQQKKQKIEQLQTVKRQMEVLFETVIDMGKMDVMIQHFGMRFFEDYRIGEDNSVVSFAESRDPNQNKIWLCETREEANAKVKQLVYYRVYDHFFRDENLNEQNLDIIKAILNGQIS